VSDPRRTNLKEGRGPLAQGFPIAGNSLYLDELWLVSSLGVYEEHFVKFEAEAGHKALNFQSYATATKMSCF
jgi:hypothetical protein